MYSLVIISGSNICRSNQEGIHYTKTSGISGYNHENDETCTIMCIKPAA